MIVLGQKPRKQQKQDLNLGPSDSKETPRIPSVAAMK